MAYKSKRANATDITQKVKQVVWLRDNQSCIYCGRTGYAVMPNAHFIPRSKGGLGVEQNVVTLCRECHHNYDFGSNETRSMIRHFIRDYLKEKYENWEESELIYDKSKL